MENPVLPDFIPGEMLNEHLASARRSVAASYRGEPRPSRRSTLTAGTRRTSPDRRPLGVAAGVALLVAMLGSSALGLLWAWLAMNSGNAMWWTFTAAAAVAATISALAAAGALLDDSVPGRGGA